MGGRNNIREVDLLGALVAGVVLGGVIVFTLLAYFWEWGVFRGARWWDVMTAFGTVGAVVFSLATALLLAIRQKRRQKRRAALRVASLGPEISALISVTWFDWLRDVELTEEVISRITYLQKDVLAAIHPQSEEFDPALNEFLFQAYEAFERAKIHAVPNFKNELGLGFSLLRNAWDLTKVARKAVGHKWIDRKLDLRKRS